MPSPSGREGPACILPRRGPARADIAPPLPAFLTLNATSGVLSGTPSAAGTYPFEVQVDDGTLVTPHLECDEANNTWQFDAFPCDAP